MDNCLKCGVELKHIEGRRKKKYCSNSCRQSHWQRNKPKVEEVENAFQRSIRWFNSLSEDKKEAFRAYCSPEKQKEVSSTQKEIKKPRIEEKQVIKGSYEQALIPETTKLQDLEKELTVLGKGFWAEKRRKQIEAEIKKLKS